MRSKVWGCLATAMAVVALSGCASEKVPESTALDDAEAAEISVSIDDTCEKYATADIETKQTYLFAGCVYMAVATSLAEVSLEEPLPRTPQCGSPEALQVPVRMATTVETFCLLDKSKLFRDAVDAYWHESMNRGTFE